MSKNFDSAEANNWFSRNVQSLQEKNFPDIELLTSWLHPFQDEISEVLEIGCGSGHRLSELAKKLSANPSGVDPSVDAISFIKKNFPGINATVGYSDSLSFDIQFDLVHLGFFMYLVDRNLYFKSISEIDRMVRPGGFLSIIDFDPLYPYWNEYSHRKGSKSFKLDNSKVFISSGMYTLVNKYSYSHQIFYFDFNPNERISLTLLHKESPFFEGP